MYVDFNSAGIPMSNIASKHAWTRKKDRINYSNILAVFPRADGNTCTSIKSVQTNYYTAA